MPWPAEMMQQKEGPYVFEGVAQPLDGIAHAAHIAGAIVQQRDLSQATFCFSCSPDDRRLPAPCRRSAAERRLLRPPRCAGLRLVVQRCAAPHNCSMPLIVCNVPNYFSLSQLQAPRYSHIDDTDLSSNRQPTLAVDGAVSAQRMFCRQSAGGPHVTCITTNPIPSQSLARCPYYCHHQRDTEGCGALRPSILNRSVPWQYGGLGHGPARRTDACRYTAQSQGIMSNCMEAAIALGGRAQPAAAAQRAPQQVDSAGCCGRQGQHTDKPGLADGLQSGGQRRPL